MRPRGRWGAPDAAPMRVPNRRVAPQRHGGISAADRAMWTRLYASSSVGTLPWAIQDPFPPLTRLVEAGWLEPPGPIIDVGCGVGSNAFWLARRGFRVTGIDVAPGAVSAAVSARAPGATNPEFAADDILASGLPARTFRGAVDVGCFQTLSRRTRRWYVANLARVLSPGAPLLVFWVGREEQGTWGPPHRLSVTEVTSPFEPSFVVDRIERRPRTAALTRRLRRSARPLATLTGYSARLLRRPGPQPPPR